jgi:hypothetical protein
LDGIFEALGMEENQEELTIIFLFFFQTRIDPSKFYEFKQVFVNF